MVKFVRCECEDSYVTVPQEKRRCSLFGMCELGSLTHSCGFLTDYTL